MGAAQGVRRAPKPWPRFCRYKLWSIFKMSNSSMNPAQESSIQELSANEVMMVSGGLRNGDLNCSGGDGHGCVTVTNNGNICDTGDR
jgi:hypothetical protein